MTICASQRQKQYYDKGLKPREYEPGDWVWRWYLPAVSNKLGQGWTGPYLVIKRISDVTYEIQLNSEKKSHSRPCGSSETIPRETTSYSLAGRGRELPG